MDVRHADADVIWQDGTFVDWEDAQTHVLTHALHYGTGVFEGVRLYETDTGPAIFRWEDHLDRLYQSARIHEMEIPFTRDELTEATLELVNRQELTNAYIRPLVYRGYDKLGLNPTDCRTSVAIAAVPDVEYLGKDAIDVMVSSWRRFNSNVSPTQAKTTGLYFNSALANQEAVKNGYDEAIFLNNKGVVSEGPGENLFMVVDDELYTAGPAESVLDGITKNSIIEMASNGTNANPDGYTIHDRAAIDRSELYTADELFFSGTAAEISPIRSVDDRVVTEPAPGPVATDVKSSFMEMIAHQQRPEWFRSP